MLNESGSVCSPDSNIAVAAAEGAAGAFIQNVADPDTGQGRLLTSENRFLSFS